MRVLFVTIPENTHLYSMVPSAWALWAAGHEVRVASTPSFAERIARTGLTAVPVGFDSEMHSGDTALRESQEVEPANWNDLDPAGLTWEGELERAQLGAWGLGYYNDPILDGLVEYARSYQPDLVIWDSMTFAGAIAARVVGAAHARFLCFADVLGVKRQLFLDLLAQGDGQRTEDPFRSLLTERAEKYGLEYGEDLFYGQWTIDQLPERLAADAGQLRIPVRFTAYNGPAVTPAWVREPIERPRICLSLGTANTERFGGDYASKEDIFEALSDLDAEVVAALLPAQAAALGTLPDNARVVEAMPLHALLPTCSAAVHHGGFGSSTTAISFGVPSLAVSTPVADQVYRGRRIEAAGAGLFQAHNEATPATIRAAVGRLLAEPSFTRNTAELREELLAHPTPAQNVAVHERLTAQFRPRLGRG